MQSLEELIAKSKGTARRHPDDEEHRLQVACVKWFHAQYPKLSRRLFAVPNGGRRDAVTGAKLKAEGVLAGVADLILLKSNSSYGALLIEMKTPKGKQSTTQKTWEEDLTHEDEYKYVVCRSLTEFAQEVHDYLDETYDN